MSEVLDISNAADLIANGVVVQIHPRQWLVPSKSEGIWRTVTWNPRPEQPWSCTCPVGENLPPGVVLACRHVHQVLLTDWRRRLDGPKYRP